MIDNHRCLPIVFSLLALAAAHPALAPQSTSGPARPPAAAPGGRSEEARKAVEDGLVEWKALHLDKAGELFARALDLAVRAGDASAEAKAHNGLGLVADYQGRYQEALSQYGKALAIWPRAGEPAEEARTLANLGQLLLLLGQTQKAFEIYNRALDLLQIKDLREVHLDVLDGAGLALHDMKVPARALSMYETALELVETPDEEARFRGRLGTVYRDLGNLDQASQELERARSLSHQTGDVRWEAFMIADLAHIADLQGREGEALRRFDQALALLEPLSEPLAKSSMLFGRAEVLRDLGRLEEAISSVDRSVSLVEPVRADLDDPGLRVSFFSKRQRYFELYVSLLMERHRRDRTGGWDGKAFDVRERSHSRSLLDDVSGEPLADTERSTLAEIQQELGADCTLLAYDLGERDSFLWRVDEDGITSFDLPKRAKVEDAVEQAWQQLSSAGSGAEVETLSRMVIPRAAVPGLRKCVLVSPDGALHKIPFTWLTARTGRPLIVDHRVSNVPSGSFLVGLRRKLAGRPPAPRELAVLADPVFERDEDRHFLPGPAQPPVGRGSGVASPDEHLARLFFSRREALAILDLVPPARRFEALGFQANRKTALSHELELARMIHISTHHIAGGHPNSSGLVLSRYDEHGRPQDGFVRESEIYQRKLMADLVVLSACETGLGPHVLGEGPIGMTRAFLHAGAKRVVVSLWNVDERSTTELMTRFYRNMLRGGLSPAEALRSAQLSMASEPEFQRLSSWKAFVLQGEPR
ncbi:MAG: CHAT domain-containing tetratricopeptide repeat protein [Acidobacteriota bacterium]